MKKFRIGRAPAFDGPNCLSGALIAARRSFNSADKFFAAESRHFFRRPACAFSPGLCGLQLLRAAFAAAERGMACVLRLNG